MCVLHAIICCTSCTSRIFLLNNVIFVFLPPGHNGIYTELANGTMEQWRGGTSPSWILQTKIHVCRRSRPLERQNLVLFSRFFFVLHCVYIPQMCELFLLFVNRKNCTICTAIPRVYCCVWVVMSYCKRDGEHCNLGKEGGSWWNYCRRCGILYCSWHAYVPC